MTRFSFSSKKAKRILEPKKKMELQAIRIISKAKTLLKALKQLMEDEETSQLTRSLARIYYEELKTYQSFLVFIKEHFSTIIDTLLPNNHPIILEIYAHQFSVQIIEVWLFSVQGGQQ